MTTVAAVVVTFDDPESLAACLAALARQTRLPDQVIVIDNASTLPVEVPTADGRIAVVRSPVNGGPGGGFALGLERFLLAGCDFAWVMDDDCEPELDSLSCLLADADEQSIIIPRLIRGDWVEHLPAWCGVLIPRAVVDTVGLPRRDFVWWAEDTEYLQWRIPKAGIAVVNSDARVRSAQPRRARAKPPWKYYYESRNSVYLRHLAEALQHRPAPPPDPGTAAGGDPAPGRPPTSLPVDAHSGRVRRVLRSARYAGPAAVAP